MNTCLKNPSFISIVKFNNALCEGSINFRLVPTFEKKEKENRWMELLEHLKQVEKKTIMWSNIYLSSEIWNSIHENFIIHKQRRMEDWNGLSFKQSLESEWSMLNYVVFFFSLLLYLLVEKYFNLKFSVFFFRISFCCFAALLILQNFQKTCLSGRIRMILLFFFLFLLIFTIFSSFDIWLF